MNKFQLSKFVVWPFMGVINETPYNVRRSNVILFGLHFGDKKPSVENFILPCVAALKEVGSKGVTDVNGVRYCNGMPFRSVAPPI
jgi:hypothetical protein